MKIPSRLLVHIKLYTLWTYKKHLFTLLSNILSLLWYTLLSLNIEARTNLLHTRLHCGIVFYCFQQCIFNLYTNYSWRSFHLVKHKIWLKYFWAIKANLNGIWRNKYLINVSSMCCFGGRNLPLILASTWCGEIRLFIWLLVRLMLLKSPSYYWTVHNHRSKLWLYLKPLSHLTPLLTSTFFHVSSFYNVWFSVWRTCFSMMIDFCLQFIL